MAHWIIQRYDAANDVWVETGEVYNDAADPFLAIYDYLAMCMARDGWDLQATEVP